MKQESSSLVSMRKLILISIVLIFCSNLISANYHEQVKFNFEKIIETNCKQRPNDSIKNLSINIKCDNKIEAEIYSLDDYDSINKKGIRIQNSIISELIETGINSINKKEKELITVARNTSIALNSYKTSIANDISNNNFNCNKTYNLNKELLNGIRYEYKCHNQSAKINDILFREKFTKKIIEKPIKVENIILFDTNFISDQNVIVEFNGSKHNSTELNDNKIRPVIIQKVKSDTSSRKQKSLIESLHNDLINYYFDKEEANWYLVGLENQSILIKNMTADLYDINNAFLEENKVMVYDRGLYLASHKINTYITSCDNTIITPRPVRVLCLD